MLLTAPKFFNLKEIAKNTVLVEDGILVDEKISEKFGNRQFYFMDRADDQLKCIGGNQLAYIVDTHNLGDKTKAVKVTFKGIEKMKTGNFKGKDVNNFAVELIEDLGGAPQAQAENVAVSTPDELE